MYLSFSFPGRCLVGALAAAWFSLPVAALTLDEALRQAEQTPAFKQLSAIQGKRFGAVDGSLWTSLGGPQAALQVITDIEQLLGKAGAQPIKR
ncbi:hypothetical protein FQZ97_1035460 [compost metagenome]